MSSEVQRKGTPESPAGTPQGTSDDLDGARRLWQEDRAYRVESGGLVGLVRRLCRPFVRAFGGDLWERQRALNLQLLDQLDGLRRQSSGLQEHVGEMGEHNNRHLTELARHQREITDYLDKEVLDQVRFLASTVEKLEGYRVEGLEDVTRHNDALFALLDQKLDGYRRETQDLWGRLGGALARVESTDAAEMVRTRAEQGYVELERRHRGTEEDIAERISQYLRYLEGRGEVLDLGCGRGESLSILRDRGIEARGVDSSAEMVGYCREKGLDVVEGDLFETLAEVPGETLGAVVSFHVIEHLAPDSVDRLVRLAYRALKPGGVLVLETPSPLSIVVAARNFWLDPTHQRPVHPASLQLSYRLAGFEPVEQIDLRPFADADRLPSLELEAMPAEVVPLARELNALRDRLDDLLFGHQDYGMIGFKP
jgi:O-antigen chain-terminating methyltransferase